jgi:hypothetical protein
MHMKKIYMTCLIVLAIILLFPPSNTLAKIGPDYYTILTNEATNFSLLADFQTYLPVVLNQPTFVLFPNGDFEQGPVIWTEFSTHGWPLIVQDLAPGVTPYEGSWAVWLGGDVNETSYIAQQVTVPENLTFMSYWYRIVSIDDCGKDIASVLVDDVVVDTYSLCAANNTGGWVKKVVDLTAYAGNLVTIKMQAVCDSAKNSNLFIDYVGFQVN